MHTSSCSYSVFPQSVATLDNGYKLAKRFQMCGLIWLLFDLCMKSTWQVLKWPMLFVLKVVMYMYHGINFCTLVATVVCTAIHQPCAVREGGGGAGTKACMFCAMYMWSGCM